MAEVNDLFAGWDEYPPTYLSVKAIVDGLSGGPRSKTVDTDTAPELSPAMFDNMQRSAMQAIAAKAGPRLPMLAGRDPELPKAKPVFDLDELRRKNAEVTKRRIAKRTEGHV